MYAGLLYACGETKPYRPAVPPGWPAPVIPEDREMTADRVLLGRKLFYDPVLSAGNDLSCASCHRPRFAFADSVPVSVGSHGKTGNRNTPSLFNVAWYPHFFAEGGVPTLELVVVGPIQTGEEMGFNLGDAVRRLSADKEYVRLFRRAYDTLPSTYTLVRALGAFQRSLVSAGSPYDRFVNGDSAALSPRARSGMHLFFSERLGCGGCHSGFLLTDFGFHNVGLSSAADPGRYRLTSDPADSGSFRTPGLRNIALTAPFMHDGGLADLPSVVDFYAAGGGNDRHKSPRLKPFVLTPAEKEALLAFLEALTDSSAVHDPDYLPLNK